MASTDLIGWFADLTLADRPSVGGKGGMAPVFCKEDRSPR